MAEHEVDPLADAKLIGDAIANTEKEIFGEALDQEEVVADVSGDRSPEDMGEGLEGQVEAASEGEDDSESDGQQTGESEGEEGDETEGADEQARDPKTGQFTAKGKDGEGDKPDPVDPKAAAKPGEGKPGETAPKPEGRVPPGRLREETERRTAAEKRATDAEAARDALSKRFDALEQQLAGFMAGQRQPPPQPQAPAKEQPQQAEAPDLFVDPQGFVEHLRKEIRAEMTAELVQRDTRFEETRVELSMQQAARGEDRETFAKGYEALTALDKSNPEHRLVVSRIWQSPNPGEAVVAWYRQVETLREVGNDPNAYREKIAAAERERLMADPEFRQQVMDGLRAEAAGGGQRGPGGTPRHVTRRAIPSLNGAGGGPGQTPNPALYDNSERSVFAHALAPSDG